MGLVNRLFCGQGTPKASVLSYEVQLGQEDGGEWEKESPCPAPTATVFYQSEHGRSSGGVLL